MESMFSGPEQVSRALLWHERQINRITQAIFGDVNVMPGEGSLTFTDAAGRVLITMDPTDVRVPHRGEIVSLSPLLEGKSEVTYVNTEISNARAAATQLVQQEAANRELQDSMGLTSAKGYTDTKTAGLASTAYVDGGDSAARTYASGQAGQALTDAKAYTNTKTTGLASTAYVDGGDASAKSYALGQAGLAESNAKAYTNTKTTGLASTAYVDGGDASAKSYAAGQAGAAESNAKAAAQGYANTAEANAKAYANGIDIDISNNQIAPLIARVNALESKVNGM